MVAMPVLVSCDKKQIRNDTDHQTPTSGQMVYNIEVTDDLLSLSDLTVTYYDGTGSTSTQTISETVTSLKITGNLPLKTGFKVSGKKKDNLSLTKDSYTLGIFLSAKTYTLYDQNGNVIEDTHSFSGSNGTGTAVAKDSIDAWFEKRESNGYLSGGYTIDANGNGSDTDY